MKIPSRFKGDPLAIAVYMYMHHYTAMGCGLLEKGKYPKSAEMAEVFGIDVEKVREKRKLVLEPAPLKGYICPKDIGTPIPRKSKQQFAKEIVQLWNEKAQTAGFPIVRSLESRVAAVSRIEKTYPWRRFWESMIDAACEDADILKDESWFGFDFCVRSITNFDKVTNHWMAWKRTEKQNKPKKVTEDQLRLKIRENCKEVQAWMLGADKASVFRFMTTNCTNIQRITVFQQECIKYLGYDLLENKP